MSEPEPYYEFEELYKQAENYELYQIEGEYRIIQHFIDQIEYHWELDHDYN